MKKKIREALFLFSSNSVLFAEGGNSKSGSDIKQSSVELLTGVVHYLMQRFEISQRNALSLFELIAEELNWHAKIPSQATLSRRISKANEELLAKNEELPPIWRNLVIGDNGEIKNCRETPKDNEKVKYDHYSVTAVLTTSHVIFSDGEIKYLRLKNLSNSTQSTNSISEIKKPSSLESWFTDNQELITPINSLFQLTPTKLFDSLIPLYPRRALNGGEWLEDIFDEYEKTNKKHELISKLIRPERPEKHRVFTTPDGAYSAMLIDLYFTNNESDPELISFIWLRCNRTKLNFIGYYKQFVRLAIYSSFSIQISRHKKTVRMKISVENKGIQLPLYVNFPHQHDENIKLKGWKDFASDLPFKIDVELANNISAKHPVVKIALENNEPSDRAMVLKHIKQWLLWNNNKAKLNDSDVDFFLGKIEKSSVFSYKQHKDVLATVIHLTDKEIPFMRKIKYAGE